MFVRETVADVAVLLTFLTAYSSTTVGVIPMLTSVWIGGTGIQSLQVAA